MRVKHWHGLALMIAFVAPIKAQASTFVFDLNGPTVAGHLNVSYEPDSNTSAVLGESPNIHDPLGSYIITGVTGSFSDTALNIANASITGLEPINKVSPEVTNLEAPSRFSLLTVANGVDDGSGHPSPGLHYDNLFYPGGSPHTSTDYPFSGGMFDIYGMVFLLDNGNAVNLWSNGILPHGGLDYGVAVTDRIDILDYSGGVAVQAVPEPATWAMMVSGFGLLGAVMRGRRSPAVTT